MTVTYCTADNVVSALRLIDDGLVRRDPDGTTDPSQAEIEDWINEAEDYIDAQTNHSWREVTVTAEPHDRNQRWDGFYEHEYQVGLRNRSVRAFSHASGDIIAVWDGSAWVDILDPVNGYTEDRAKDFYVDYASGIVYLITKRPVCGKGVVKVTYRYGEATVPKDIKAAAEKFAALRILESDFSRIAMPQGNGFDNTHAHLVDKWDRDIEKIIDRRREVRAIRVV
jgi:hypothetical protein